MPIDYNRRIPQVEERIERCDGITEENKGLLRDFFEGCRKGESEGFMSLVSFTELYYILCREGEDLAEEKTTNLLGFGVKMVGIEEKEVWKKAAKIKANQAIPLADSYVAATARALDSKLVIGRDEHFQNLNLDLIEIG